MIEMLDTFNRDRAGSLTCYMTCCYTINSVSALKETLVQSRYRYILDNGDNYIITGGTLMTLIQGIQP